MHIYCMHRTYIKPVQKQYMYKENTTAAEHTSIEHAYIQSMGKQVAQCSSLSLSEMEME